MTSQIEPNSRTCRHMALANMQRSAMYLVGRSGLTHAEQLVALSTARRYMLSALSLLEQASVLKIAEYAEKSTPIPSEADIDAAVQEFSSVLEGMESLFDLEEGEEVEAEAAAAAEEDAE